jgi:hypothetical protein
MKIWHINWASIADAECTRDDAHEIDVEFMASPNGVLLADIADLDKIKALVVAEDREMYGEEHEETGDNAYPYVEGEWIERDNRGDYRTYTYGDWLVIATLKEVL